MLAHILSMARLAVRPQVAHGSWYGRSCLSQNCQWPELDILSLWHARARAEADGMPAQVRSKQPVTTPTPSAVVSRGRHSTETASAPAFSAECTRPLRPYQPSKGHQAASWPPRLFAMQHYHYTGRLWRSSAIHKRNVMDPPGASSTAEFSGGTPLADMFALDQGSLLGVEAVESC